MTEEKEGIDIGRFTAWPLTLCVRTATRKG
ncbi:MAG: hypothetical protein K0Q46_871 [Rhodococcus erythropolis]|jgi:hypothetical protein|nr:hypothetical protein [Rhodococcus erythropolis]